MDSFLAKTWQQPERSVPLQLGRAFLESIPTAEEVFICGGPNLVKPLFVFCAGWGSGRTCEGCSSPQRCASLRQRLLPLRAMGSPFPQKHWLCRQLPVTIVRSDL